MALRAEPIVPGRIAVADRRVRSAAAARAARSGHLVLAWSVFTAGVALDVLRDWLTYGSMHLVLPVVALVYAVWRTPPRLVTVIFWTVASWAIVEAFWSFLGDSPAMALPWWNLGAVALVLGGVHLARTTRPRA